METTENCLIEKVACDWLSLSTWEPLLLAEVSKWLEGGEGPEPTPGRWLQYKGARGPDWFTGHALQDDLDHHVAWIAGARADDALRYFAPLNYFADAFSKCTRLDVQLTLPDWPRRWRLSRAAERLEAGRMGRWPNIPGEGPNIRYWGNKTGDTIYIGSRQSPVMVRIYQKEVTGSRFIRVEIEYKAGRAHSLYNDCEADASAPMEGALAAEIKAWPEGFRGYMQPFAEWAETRTGLRPALLKVPTTDERRLEWLRRIGPTLGDLARSESVGQEARAELVRILWPTA